MTLDRLVEGGWLAGHGHIGRPNSPARLLRQHQVVRKLAVKV